MLGLDREVVLKNDINAFLNPINSLGVWDTFHEFNYRKQCTVRSIRVFVISLHLLKVKTVFNIDICTTYLVHS